MMALSNRKQVEALSDTMSLRSCANLSRRVSHMYNLAGVLDLNILAILAARLPTLRGSGRVQ
jgi:hypothetical protein